MVLNKNFCPTPTPLIHRRVKHRQRTKITKQCVLSPPHWFSTQNSEYQNWKGNKYFILTIIELGPPGSESSTGSQNFMLPVIKSWNKPRDSSLPWNCASIIRIASIPMKTKTNLQCFNYLKILYTLNYAISLVVGQNGSSKTSGKIDENLGLFSRAPFFE